MELFQAFILGMVQGLGEFLPISSTGHLILTSKLLKIPQTNFVKSFEIFIQLGAIMAVVFLYRKNLLTKLSINSTKPISRQTPLMMPKWSKLFVDKFIVFAQIYAFFTHLLLGHFGGRG